MHKLEYELILIHSLVVFYVVFTIVLQTKGEDVTIFSVWLLETCIELEKDVK